jgi:Winged helix-turn helix
MPIVSMRINSYATRCESVGALLRRRKVKLKTGRPRHEKADKEEQEAFKKSSPRKLKRVASASVPTNR